MRIIGGSAGGQLLKVPDGFGVRPTPDKVRQAIFNSLGDRVDGAKVLELFGGTGALCLECLSRGSASAMVVEKSSKHAEFIRRNAASVGLDGRLHLRVQDAYGAIHQMADAGQTFDLIFADPPYGLKNVGKRSESFSQKLLDDPQLPKLLADGGLFVLGHTKRDTLQIPEVWSERKEMKHGDTMFRFLEPVTDQSICKKL
jgi:16S rRNA (guanine966-N2)-methyltransferase